MNSPVEYWVWLQRTLGAGKRLDDILMYFGDPEKLYEAGRSAWIESGVMGVKTADMLTKFSPSQSYDIMKKCSDNGWSIVTYDSEYYPEFLKNIYCFPIVLYVWGDVTVLNERVKIGMVGTRNPSEYSIGVAENLAYSLAEAGAVVVSGGAIGIDSASHRGAIRAHGKTIAFLGCGLGYNYLVANQELRKSISENGAVVSEFLPFSPPTRQTFPIRNRLISGISLGTVVVEAGEKSGSLITAKFAVEQGRDVFAVPGDVTGSRYFGANGLIRDGAKPVFSPMDVIESYGEKFGEYLSKNKNYVPIANGNRSQKQRPVKQVTWSNVEKRVTPSNKTANKESAEEKVKAVKEQLPDYATANAKLIYKIMTEKGMTADEFVIKSDLPVQDVLSALTELEMLGFTEMLSGKRYALKNT